MVPPPGYYTPNYASVDRKIQRVEEWKRGRKEGRKTEDWTEKVAEREETPRKRTSTGVDFDKQLPRPALTKGSPSPHEQRFNRLPILPTSAHVPNLSKSLPRSLPFPVSNPTPVYHPKFTSIWTPLSRTVKLGQMTGHKTLQVQTNDLVYDRLSYGQVRPKVASPNLLRGGRPLSSGSALPLFMRKLSSWQSLAESLVPFSHSTWTSRNPSLSTSPAPNRLRTSLEPRPNS